jgi:ATP-dependent Clp protease protease subunit
MLHQPLGGSNGQASDIVVETREVLRLRAQICRIYSKITGSPLALVAQDMDRDRYLSSQDAKDYGQYGIVDRIADEVPLVNLQTILAKQESSSTPDTAASTPVAH